MKGQNEDILFEEIEGKKQNKDQQMKARLQNILKTCRKEIPHLIEKSVTIIFFILPKKT